MEKKRVRKMNTTEKLRKEPRKRKQIERVGEYVKKRGEYVTKGSLVVIEPWTTVVEKSTEELEKMDYEELCKILNHRSVCGSYFRRVLEIAEKLEPPEDSSEDEDEDEVEFELPKMSKSADLKRILGNYKYPWKAMQIEGEEDDAAAGKKKRIILNGK